MTGGAGSRGLPVRPAHGAGSRGLRRSGTVLGGAGAAPIVQVHP